MIKSNYVDLIMQSRGSDSHIGLEEFIFGTIAVLILTTFYIFSQRKKTSFIWIHLGVGVVIPKSNYLRYEEGYLAGHPLIGFYGIYDHLDPRALQLKRLFSNHTYPFLRWVTVKKDNMDWDFLVDVKRSSPNLRSNFDLPFAGSLSWDTPRDMPPILFWFISPLIAQWQLMENIDRLVLSGGKYPSADVIASSLISRELLLTKMNRFNSVHGFTFEERLGTNAPCLLSIDSLTLLNSQVFDVETNSLVSRPQGNFNVMNFVFAKEKDFRAIYHTKNI